MSPEKPLVDSPEDADIFASVVQEGGAGIIITSHQIGDETSYSLWRRVPGKEDERITLEQLHMGKPQWEILRNFLVEIYVSMLQDAALLELVEEVTKRADSADEPK